MVAYGFKREFIDPILSGRKRHTLRNPRPRHARPGEALQLYFGLRTSSCRLIGTAVCVSIRDVQVWPNSNMVAIGEAGRGVRLSTPDDLSDFAYADGFETWSAMADFWRTTHPGPEPWRGVIIDWAGFKPAPPPETG